MAYVRLSPNKPWHMVKMNQTLCNVQIPQTPHLTVEKRLSSRPHQRPPQWTKEVRKGERVCVNCWNIANGHQPKWQEKPKTYNEEKGKANLEGWRKKMVSGTRCSY